MCDCMKHTHPGSPCTCICLEHKNFQKAHDLAMQRYDVIVEQATRIQELEAYISKVATLTGATTDPEMGVRVGTAGEFAARWNGMLLEQRERIVTHLLEAQDTAQACVMKNHEGLQRQLEDQRLYDFRATDQIENLLADELYDGGSGPMSVEQVEEYRRNLARKLNAEFGGPVTAPLPKEPATSDTQWYAYWEGVSQAVQHWANGTDMRCPYEAPPAVGEVLNALKEKK